MSRIYNATAVPNKTASNSASTATHKASTTNINATPTPPTSTLTSKLNANNISQCHSHTTTSNLSRETTGINIYI